jgi:hypothetical protein
MNFAQQLQQNIRKQSELNRLTHLFTMSPNTSVETTLSYAEAKELGFEVYSSQRDGVQVTLPKNNYSQFGDH